MYNLIIFPKYRDSDNIEGTFKEVDILCMNELFLESMKPLVNDTIGLALQTFFKKFESSPANTDTNGIAQLLQTKVQLMKDILGPSIEHQTLHRRMADDGTIALVESLKLDTVKQLYRGKEQEVLTKLKYLLDHEYQWQSSIQPRKKADFEIFSNYCRYLEAQAQNKQVELEQKLGNQYSLDRTENLRKWINNSKDSLFYSSEEKERSTKMNICYGRKDLIVEVIHGMEYQILCQTARIPLGSTRGML